MGAGTKPKVINRIIKICYGSPMLDNKLVNLFHIPHRTANIQRSQVEQNALNKSIKFKRKIYNVFDRQKNKNNIT